MDQQQLVEPPAHTCPPGLRYTGYVVGLLQQLTLASVAAHLQSYTCEVLPAAAATPVPSATPSDQLAGQPQF